ncbi:MAG: metal ABC transporter permease [Pseudomonadota bacterium]
MPEILTYEFMQNAIIAALLASISCGIIGAFVVVKKIVSISGGIAHTSFGGIGLGYFLGINPFFMAIPFSLVAAVFIGLLKNKSRLAEDTTIGIFWSIGMAIGILFIGLTPGYTSDLTSYLFGNILTVPNLDLLLMLILNIVIIISIFFFYKEFFAISFDEEYAQVSGIKANMFYIFLLILISLTVIILIKVVGIILVIALLTLPAACARQFTYNFKKMIGISIGLGILFNLFGLLLSYHLDLPSGATIILVSAFVFLLILASKKIISSSNLKSLISIF